MKLPDELRYYNIKLNRRKQFYTTGRSAAKIFEAFCSKEFRGKSRKEQTIAENKDDYQIVHATKKQQALKKDTVETNHSFY